MAADLTILPVKVVEVLRNDTDLVTELTNNGSSAVAITVGPVNPVKRFPAVTVEDMPENSEVKIPARHGELIVTSWFSMENHPPPLDPVKTLGTITNRILTVLDFNEGSAVSNITGIEATDIRVMKFQRIEGGGSPVWDNQLGKLKVPIVFSYTMSYNEVGHAYPADTDWV